MHGLRVEPHGEGGCAVARDGAVVVLSPQIDELVEAPRELLRQVTDVRCEIRWLPVGPIHHPILVVAEGRRPEPGGAILLVDVASLSELLDGALNPFAAVQRPLAGPYVEAHAEALQALLDACPHPFAGPAAEDLTGVRAGLSCRRPDLVRQAGGQVDHVLAVIAILRDGVTDTA